MCFIQKVKIVIVMRPKMWYNGYMLKGESMDELAMKLEEAGLDVTYFYPHNIYVDDFMAFIEYAKEHNVYLIEKKDDADIFEVDTPVEEMIDWMR